MKNTAVLGLQWGDEGKGKIVTNLSRYYDIVVRFQGGRNAGHSVFMDDGREIILHLIPCGMLFDKDCVLGAGMVLNIEKLYEEIHYLKNENMFNGKLLISNRIHLTFEDHLLRDITNEETKDNIGTTLNGIGPTYADKISRVGYRFCDIDAGLLKLNIREKYYYEFIKSNALFIDVPTYLDLEKKNNKNILFEGAQGTHLDIDYGDYPYVTSSNTTIGSVFTSCGYQEIQNRVGVFKAYATRVGNGPFDTEITSENDLKMSEHILKIGDEYGKTTKRKRRIGWLDLDIIKRSVLLNGINKLIMTKLDVLSGLRYIKVFYNGQYITFEGWDENIERFNDFFSLPWNAKYFIKSVNKLLGGNMLYAVSINKDVDKLLFLNI